MTIVYTQSADIANIQKYKLQDSVASKTKIIKPLYSHPYYDDYSNQLALFLYAKQKYTRFSMYHHDLKKSLEYSPNEQLNMGFGFNYKWLGIGIAFNFGFVNHDDKQYGKTKRLDMQTNIYMKKMVVDFYFQYYEGFYIKNVEDIFPDREQGHEEYIRPDIKTLSFGIGGMYVFNHDRFSYKSAFKQTAIQKKSAGSFLLGGQIFLEGIGADSSFFPEASHFGNLPKANEHNAVYFGVLSAYAYNLIIRKHFFVSMSFMASIHLGLTNTYLEDNTHHSNSIPVLHLQPRMAVGINKPKWYAGFSFVRDSFYELSDDEKREWAYSSNIGHFRIFIGRRFSWFIKEE